MFAVTSDLCLVAVVEGVFGEQVAQGADGGPPDVPALSQGPLHFLQQQPHQEVVATELCRQRVVMLQI